MECSVKHFNSFFSLCMMQHIDIDLVPRKLRNKFWFASVQADTLTIFTMSHNQYIRRRCWLRNWKKKMVCVSSVLVSYAGWQSYRDLRRMNVTVNNEYSEVSPCHPDNYYNSSGVYFFLEMILVLWNLKKKEKKNWLYKRRMLAFRGFPVFVEECCIWRVYM